jgi:hypothetical protein
VAEELDEGAQVGLAAAGGGQAVHGLLHDRDGQVRQVLGASSCLLSSARMAALK